MEILAPEITHNLILPWQPLKIMPIGDIQYAGKNGATAVGLLKKQIKWGLDNDCWFIGMGDYCDFASPSNRARLKSADMYDTAAMLIDQAATDVEDELKIILAPTIGRWLTLVEGHHYYEHLDGTTTGQRFSNFLKTPYSGDAALLRLTFKHPNNTGSVVTKIFVHHGHGSATTLGGALAKLERFASRNSAQVMLIGHYHQVMMAYFDYLDVTDKGDPHLFHIPRAIVLTGSFMEGWQQGSKVGLRPSGLYPEKKLLPPVTLGGPFVVLNPVEYGKFRIKIVDIGGGKSW